MSLPTVYGERWMAKRLELPLDWDAGVTTADERRERIRAAIVEQGRERAIAGKRPGQPCETWADLYARVYGVPFQPQPTEKKSCAE